MNTTHNHFTSATNSTEDIHIKTEPEYAPEEMYISHVSELPHSDDCKITIDEIKLSLNNSQNKIKEAIHREPHMETQKEREQNFEFISVSDAPISMSQKTPYDSNTLKNYSCSVCSKTFVYQQSLVKHMTLHKGQKTYKCDKCDEYFTKKKLLLAHRDTHIDNKYTCDVCNSTFVRKVWYNRHKAKHKHVETNGERELVLLEEEHEVKRRTTEKDEEQEKNMEEGRESKVIIENLKVSVEESDLKVVDEVHKEKQIKKEEHDCK